MIKAEGVSVAYENNIILRDIYLHIKEHEFIVVVGPNGSGKTAAAYQITYKLKTMFLLAMIFGIVSTLSGLTAAVVFEIPAGAATVLCSVILVVMTLIFSPKHAALRSN